MFLLLEEVRRLRVQQRLKASDQYASCTDLLAGAVAVLDHSLVSDTPSELLPVILAFRFTSPVLQ